MLRTRFLIAAVAVVLVGGLVVQTLASAKDEQDAALERTRKNVRVLDDIYKTTVVLITDKYVKDDTDLPAGTAAKALFTAIKKKGGPETRILDVTGEPLVSTNVPTDAFEKEAAKQLLAGKTSYDQVEHTKEGRILRAATPVPVVMKKCVMCHPNYSGVKPGTPIGMLTYRLKIE